VATILIVDDDKKAVATIGLYLRNEGHTILEAYSGAEAIDRFRDHAPDLIVLDLMLPTIDGIDVAKLVRLESSVPIIMVTARGFEDDKLTGFAAGADDYVVKPFSPRELAARVRALLRRSNGEEEAYDLLETGDLRIDPGRREVSWRGRQIRCTRTEFDVLTVLARSPGRVFSRSQLVAKVFGEEYQGADRSIDTHISGIRKKLGADAESLLQTVHGVGYRLQDPGSA
jgi:DNA-binding response OmpR family regulator